MYFGSVRFFKHLIITVVLLLILVPTVLAVIFSIQNKEEEEKLRLAQEENASLSLLLEQYTGGENLTAEKIYQIISAAGVDLKDFINLVYDKDKTPFQDIIDQWIKDNTVPDISEDNDTEQTEPDLSGEDLPAARQAAGGEMENPSPYAELLPDLYASSVTESYYDDNSCVYLTFDDGPSQYTTEILDILDEFQIHATFFLVPEDTEESFGLMNEIVDRGHAIGVHSYSRDYNKIYSSVENYLEDFNQARNLIQEATGIECRCFRFPGGSVNTYNSATMEAIIEEMTRRGFVYFDWNVDSEDGIGANVTTIYNNVLNETAGADRAVILLHDGIYNTTLALEDIIRALLADTRSFTFGVINDSVRPMQF